MRAYLPNAASMALAREPCFGGSALPPSFCSSAFAVPFSGSSFSAAENDLRAAAASPAFACRVPARVWAR